MKVSIHTVFLFSWLWMDWESHGEKVEQVLSTLSVQEGDTAVINCTYTDSTSSYFPWYKQGAGKGLHFVIDIRSNVDKKETQRFKILLDKKAKKFSLHITATQAEDSAIYFCSARYNQGKLIFGQGTKLSIKPNVTDPEPAVYQLKDPQSDNITLCLFTDFDSQTNVSQSASSEAFVSGNTVMDMKAMDSKSNGAIAWSNQTSFSCKDAFKKNASHPTSDVPCDAKLVEKSFETDMNLNFQNLSVMGLRILLLKVAGFNLLMTLRLWSS